MFAGTWNAGERLSSCLDRKVCIREVCWTQFCDFARGVLLATSEKGKALLCVLYVIWQNAKRVIIQTSTASYCHPVSALGTLEWQGFYCRVSAKEKSSPGLLLCLKPLAFQNNRLTFKWQHPLFLKMETTPVKSPCGTDGPCLGSLKFSFSTFRLTEKLCTLSLWQICSRPLKVKMLNHFWSQRGRGEEMMLSGTDCSKIRKEICVFSW